MIEKKDLPLSIDAICQFGNSSISAIPDISNLTGSIVSTNHISIVESTLESVKNKTLDVGASKAELTVLRSVLTNHLAKCDSFLAQIEESKKDFENNQVMAQAAAKIADDSSDIGYALNQRIQFFVSVLQQLMFNDLTIQQTKRLLYDQIQNIDTILAVTIAAYELLNPAHKTDINLAALQDTACKNAKFAYEMAKLPGADIAKCQEGACQDAEYAYLFAKDIKGADIAKCQAVVCIATEQEYKEILSLQSPRHAYSSFFYDRMIRFKNLIYLFALNVKGADILTCQKAGSFDAGWAFKFVETIKGSSIEMCQEFVKDSPEYSFKLAEHISKLKPKAIVKKQEPVTAVLHIEGPKPKIGFFRSLLRFLLTLPKSFNG